MWGKKRFQRCVNNDDKNIDDDYDGEDIDNDYDDHHH